MIQSFSCTDTCALFQGKRVPRFANFETVAQRKLAMLDAAVDFKDLLSPPGNRLEMLSGDRAGQASIRINAKWRICFRWTATGPANVEITDYH